MKYRNRLFSSRDPYDTDGTDELFVSAMKENCAYHYANNEKYRRILDAEGFSPDMIRETADLERLPFIPTAALKKHDLNTDSGAGHVTVTSSGTSGSMSTIHYDLGTIIQAGKMALKVAGRRGLISLKPVNYIVFGYKPHKGNRTAATKTAFLTTLLAPAIKRVYALTYRDGRYEPDLEGVIDAIIRFSKSKFPTRFMGFPSYTYFVMKMLDERGIRLNLPKGSKIMLGGGWKQYYREKADKQTFYDLAEKTLGVGAENIIEFYGAAEHAILYCDCPNHRFHVPVYGRVMIRDTRTLKKLGFNETGLVNLMSPMVKSSPVLSVMTDDLGILRDGRRCGCGITSPVLEIVGRVGLREIMTCAAGAENTLKESKAETR